MLGGAQNELGNKSEGFKKSEKIKKDISKCEQSRWPLEW